ncbi:MAG: flagellar basal-body rod protein FlgG [Clostridiales bacterium]|nr:flagellar basal-body rod protein FlgG [Clostridiales bacterium]
MMRSLWTAASGMISQQQNVDTISNNLANVSTFGYKKERMEFKTLLYETMSRADLDPANQTGRPVNLQVGHGVKPIATARIFTEGNFERTDNQQDFAIEGNGFFSIDRGDGDIKYTKDGAFKISATEEGAMLATAEGYPVLGVDDQPIIIGDEVPLKSVTVSEDGILGYMTPQGLFEDLGMQIKLVQFSNPQGLEGIGSNLLSATTASGQPLSEAEGDAPTLSRIKQGVLEMSNVQVAEEMVNLIVAQRAYDLNSKAITTSDEMLQTANGLKR